MKAKIFLIAALLFVITLNSNANSTPKTIFNSSVVQRSTMLESNVREFFDDYKYVVVYIDNIRWIFVYDPDGHLVDSWQDQE